MARKKSPVSPDVITLPGLLEEVGESLSAPAEFGGKDFGKYKGPKKKPVEDEERSILFDIDDTFDDEDEDYVDEVVEVKQIEMRDYQIRAGKAIIWAISNKNPNRVDRTMVVMATGTGKTSTAVDVIDKLTKVGRRVLIVCAQDELIRQWVRALSFVGITGLVEKAGERAAEQIGKTSEVVVVASLQSMSQERLERYWEPDYFDVIMHDECDLCAGEMWTNLINYFAPARQIGWTATPDRLDGQNLGKIFQSCCFEYHLDQAVREGWLVRPVFMEAQHEEIDLTSLRFTDKDFNRGDLDALISSKVESLANGSKPLIGDRQTIAFVPTVASAHAMADAFNKIGVSAIAVSGKSKERRQIFADFEAGVYQVLCNSMLVTRGVDIPNVSCIILARPTSSRALYSQMIGRGTRLFPGKEDCLVVDFAWKFQDRKHKPVSPVVLYDDLRKYTPQVVERAEKLVKEAEIADVKELMVLAEEQIKEEMLERLIVRERTVDVTVRVNDPMVFEVMGVKRKPSTAIKPDLMTDRQREVLTNFKVDVSTLGEVTRSQAKRLLDRLTKRRRDGYATWPQVAFMIRCGMSAEEAEKVSFEEARAYLSVASQSKKRG